MVKANSLLYAVYVCLIVSIICGALLFYAGLYERLNLFYNTREDLYIQNQSAVNYALGNGFPGNIAFQEESSGIQSVSETKKFGLLDILLVKSFVKEDTITSVHFVGQYATDKTGLYVTNFSKEISYEGDIKLIGETRVPSAVIVPSNLSVVPGKLTVNKPIGMSDNLLPVIDPKFEKIFNTAYGNQVRLKDISRKKDSIYYNSFQNPPIEITLVGPILDNIIIKGNFILHAADSVEIRKGAILEDVILVSPKVAIKDGFKGNLQIFAGTKIETGNEVVLNYPSILCLYNKTRLKKSEIIIGEKNKINGSVVLFGSEQADIDLNVIMMKEKSFLAGDIYCSGRLMVGGTVYGSVYANRLFVRTIIGAEQNNLIIGTQIDNSKRPAYFIGISLFETNKSSYGIFKKVL